MKKFLVLALVGLSQISLADLPEKMSLEFDGSVTNELKSLVVKDIGDIQSYKINAKPNSIFSKVFGGTDAKAVLTYIDDRLNYMISFDQDLDKLIEQTDATARVRDEKEDSKTPSRAMILGVNPSFPVWLMEIVTQAQSKGKKHAELRINGTLRPIESSYVGVFQLGDSYNKVPSVVRTGTIVHEARHSDCTGGLYIEDAVAMLKGKTPKSHSCGNLHVNCPKGHSYEGLPACDGQPWGAYAVGAIYASAVASSDGLSEEEIQQAKAEALDSFSRVLNLKDMMDGKLGSPDMVNSTKIMSRDNKPVN